MSRNTLGMALIAGAAGLEIIIPVLVDGGLYASAHMSNPRWLPHAKLHCAMSFHAAVLLGAAALAVLVVHRRSPGRADLGIAAALSAAFWVCLITAGQWPGTSFTFAGDPAFVDQTTPVVLGVSVVPNVAIAVALIVVSAVGYGLAARRLHVTAP